MYACVVAALFSGIEYYLYNSSGVLPGLKNLWWAVLVFSLLGGAGTTIGCGGAAFWKRIVAGVLGGIAAALLYSIFTFTMSHDGPIAAHILLSTVVWRAFSFSILWAIGVLIAEIR